MRPSGRFSWHNSWLPPACLPGLHAARAHADQRRRAHAWLMTRARRGDEAKLTPK
jgi:hypothetical protein